MAQDVKQHIINAKRLTCTTSKAFTIRAIDTGGKPSPVRKHGKRRGNA
jgi:hypothetical protein